MESKVAENVTEGKWIVGIDEAGRGPVLGPMVYAVAYCPRDFQSTLEDMNVDDSKVLSAQKREKHFETVLETPEIGFVADRIAPQEISAKMLEKEPVSLNLIALESTLKLLKEVLKLGIHIEHVYVDTLGKPETHKGRLKAAFPEVDFTVSARADALFPIVSLASIVAKVRRLQFPTMHSFPHEQVLRDKEIEKIQDSIEMPIGCGYPSDPNTIRYLKHALHPIFGFPNHVRLSWATCTK